MKQSAYKRIKPIQLNTNHISNAKENYQPIIIKIIYIFLFIILACQQTFSQIIVADPYFPTVNDSVTIIFDSSQGNRGLVNYTGDVYAHTGVITNLSTSSSDWKHAPVWGDNSNKYKLTRLSTNLYQLKIVPSIKAYYGLLDNEKVKQLAFVFRSADKTKEGKTETNGDIFYDIVNDTLLHVKLLIPSTYPVITEIGKRIPIWLKANKADSFQLYTNNMYIKSYYSFTTLVDTLEVTQNGKHWVIIKAFKGLEMAMDSFYYFVKNETTIENIPNGCTDGINYLNDSTICLVLVTPTKTSAFVIGEFNNWELDTTYQMKQTPDKSRFWIKITHLTPGREYAYQYIVDNQKIADPFCQKILDPWNDKYISNTTYPSLKAYPEGKTSGIVSVFQTAPPSFAWKYTTNNLPSKEKLVTYELLVRDFHASHSYQAIIDSINYLKNLGINAIELMPITEFEGNESWGYNPSFYFAPDKYYGPSELLKKLIDTCHSLGIAVILDMVLNHSFGQSPMVQLYWDTLNNRPASHNPWFNPLPKHEFNVGYDFNHESSYTKLFVSQVLKFWLNEYHIDGFRFDLSKGFTQKNTIGNVTAWGQYDSTRVKILKTYADTIWKTNPNAYVILEHFADNQEEKILTNYGFMIWGNSNYNYREASMGWNNGSNSDFSWGSYQTRGFSNPALVTYMESHDEERLMYSNITYGNNSNPLYPIKGNLQNAIKRAELCAAFFFTIPGPKMIWQFGELGYDYSIEFNGRLGNKPIRWDYYQNPYRLRLYKIYSELIRLRNQYQTFHTSNYSLNVNKPVKTITLLDNEMNVLVVGNFDVYSQTPTITFPVTGWWYNYFYGDSIYVSQASMSMILQAGEYRIYTTRRLPTPNIIAATEVLNININNMLYIYPNPFHDVLIIQRNSIELTKLKIEIYDITGKILITKLLNDLNNIKIPTHQLNKGIYFIKITDSLAQSVQIVKILKE